MKIICVPDIHQTTHWKKTIPLLESVDKIVFLGDYVDNWVNSWPEQMHNLMEIIEFKKSFPDKICLCWGNHDTSYYLGEKCSGFQPERYLELKEFFTKNENCFEVVFIFDNWIFSHAGVSKEWMNSANINLIEEINSLFKTNPNYFRWVGPNIYGYNENEGPLWIRPESLTQVAIEDFNQCVGHSEEDNNPKFHITILKNKVLTIDDFEHDKIIKLNTGNYEYKII